MLSCGKERKAPKKISDLSQLLDVSVDPSFMYTDDDDKCGDALADKNITNNITDNNVSDRSVSDRNVTDKNVTDNNVSDKNITDKNMIDNSACSLPSSSSSQPIDNTEFNNLNNDNSKANIFDFNSEGNIFDDDEDLPISLRNLSSLKSFSANQLFSKNK